MVFIYIDILLYSSYSETFLKDPLNKGHSKFDLSIKDKLCGPYRIMTIQYYH